MAHSRVKSGLTNAGGGLSQAGQSGLLQSMLDSSSISMFALDREYRYLAFNREHVDIMQTLYQAGNIQVGYSALDYMNIPQDREGLKILLDQALAGQEASHSGPTGAQELSRWYFRTRCVPLRDEHGGVVGVVVSSEDISSVMDAEQALTSSEELFRISFIHSSIGKALIAADGKFLRVNPALCRMLGYTETELAGMTFNDVTYAADLDLGATFIKDAMAGLVDMTRFEKRYLTRNGQIIWADVSSVVFRDAAGEFQYLVTTINEITGVKQAQAELLAHKNRLEEMVLQRTRELRFSEARYRGLFENMSSVILILEPRTGAILDANQEACRFYGYSHDRLTSMKIMDLGLLSAKESRAVMKKVLTGGLKAMTTTHCLASGETREVEIFPGIIEQDDWKAILTVVHDITERRQTELALLGKELELRTLIDSIPGLIWSSLPDGNVDYLNQGWLNFTGLTQEQAHGQGWFQALHPDDKQKTSQKWADAAQIGIAYEVEQRLRRYDGEYHWFLTRANPVRDARGVVIKWYGVNTDITDHKHMSLAVNQRMQQLTCLYRVGRLLEDQTLLESELCQQVLETLVPAMQFPELASALIELEDRQYQTANYVPGLTHGLKASISMKARVYGQVSVYYSTPQPFLLPDEQDLLDNAARMLGLWFERHKSEALVRKFTQAVEQSPGSIVIADITGKIEYVNPHFTELTGYTQEEAIGENPRILKTGHTTQAEYDQLWKTILGGGIWQGEFLNRKKNGDLYWENATISPIRDETARITHLLAVKENITARKKDQASIADALEFNQTIFDTSPIGITIYKASGECISANPAAALILGADHTSLLKQNFHTIKSWKQCELYGAAMHTLQTSQPLSLQVRSVNSLGEDLWMSATFASFTSGGEPHLMFMFEDNSEQQKAEHLLELSNEKLGAIVFNLEQSKRNSDLLRQMGELLQLCREMEEAYTVIQQFGLQLFPGAPGAVYLRDQAHLQFGAAVTWGASLNSEQTFLMDDCWALRRGQVHIVKPGQPVLTCHHMGRAYAGSYIDIPINILGEPLCLMHIEFADQASPDDGTSDLAQSMAENLSLSLSNIRLRQTLEYQSVRDPLTGTFNRRYMEETLTREMNRAARKKSTLSIIMLDIDHFKKFNDTFGHAAGDLVLTRLSALLQSQVREEDVVCRMGGEEFVMILQDTCAEVGMQRAESIRAAVTSQSLEYDSRTLGMVTVSMGVAVFPQHGSSGEEILKKADKAMYRAKHRGRNCVELAT